MNISDMMIDKAVYKKIDSDGEEHFASASGYAGSHSAGDALLDTTFKIGGRIKVSLTCPDGAHWTVQILKNGNVIGEETITYSRVPVYVYVNIEPLDRITVRLAEGQHNGSYLIDYIGSIVDDVTKYVIVH